MPKAVAILEVMWDWEARTSGAGYTKRAPPYFRINGENHTGRRLYKWLGHTDLLVTNACPELVNNPSKRGKPDPTWLSINLQNLMPFNLLLVCGKVAQRTYQLAEVPIKGIRVIELPHPAARMWSMEGLNRVRDIIQNETGDFQLYFHGRDLIELSGGK